VTDSVLKVNNSSSYTSWPIQLFWNPSQQILFQSHDQKNCLFVWSYQRWTLLASFGGWLKKTLWTWYLFYDPTDQVYVESRAWRSLVFYRYLISYK